MQHPRIGSTAALVVGFLFVANPSRVRADLLLPGNFQSLGAFPTAAGVYTLNTVGTPTITTPGGAVYTGVYAQDSPGNTVAVFTFDSINLTANQSIVPNYATIAASPSLTPPPVALLSQSNATIAGTVDVSGIHIYDPVNSVHAPGPGGYWFGPGIGTGGSGNMAVQAGPGGSGFGGPGQTGGGFPDVPGGAGGSP
jgi:hypothetical protein